MPDYSKPRFPKKPFNRGGSDRFQSDRQMHKANCSNCGNACEVPFRPNGKKPIFCSNCFVKDDAPRSTFAPKRDFAARPSFNAAPARDDRGMQELKREMQSINEKLSRMLSLMEVAQVPVVAKAPAAKKVAKKATKKK